MSARTSYLEKRTSANVYGIEAADALVKRINYATFSATDGMSRFALIE